MKALRAALAVLSFCIAASAHALDLWGTVSWTSGAPAAGIELRLVQRGRVLPTRILTNGVGRYGLYGLSEPTTDYQVQVLRNGALVKVVPLPNLRNGDRVQDIVLP